jgi:site-specific DNA-methyltransferase (adenine-specific)
MEAMKDLESDSVDACVTDPPYHLTSIVKRFGGTSLDSAGTNEARARAGADGMARLSRGFMGKIWDGGDIAFRPETWAEILRVLKPGGHLLAFSGTRTQHRMVCAIEDAGFDIREMIAWVYGSGFPKSHNLDGDWQGWGTALKPALEPITLARKPLTGTVAANVMQHGTGALNIDGCRVEAAGEKTGSNGAFGLKPERGWNANSLPRDVCREQSITQGRWPANLIHDGSDEVVAAFPNAPGQLRSTGPQFQRNANVYGKYAGVTPAEPRGDSGSAARFFYAAKASRGDRDNGLEGMPKQKAGFISNTSGQHMTRRDEGYEVKPRANTHPTVKPTDLMRYLCRLITPPRGIVLDPFMGSGSTGMAAELEGFKFIGIEREQEYFDIAVQRIRKAGEQADMFLHVEATG